MLKLFLLCTDFIENNLNFSILFSFIQGTKAMEDIFLKKLYDTNMINKYEHFDPATGETFGVYLNPVGTTAEAILAGDDFKSTEKMMVIILLFLFLIFF